MKKKRRYIFMTSIFMQVIMYVFFLFFIVVAIIMGFVEGWDSQIIMSVVGFVLVEIFMVYCGITQGIFLDYEEDILLISLGFTVTRKDRIVRSLSDIRSIDVEKEGSGVNFVVVHKNGIPEKFYHNERYGIGKLRFKRLKRELSKCIPSNIDDAA